MEGTERKITNLLRQIASEQKYQDFDLQLTHISSGGANYTSTLHLAKITSEGMKDLHLFVKAAAMSEDLRDRIAISVFSTERFMYTNVLKTFRDIEEKYSVPAQHKLRFSKYYGSSLTHLEELLVLENLTASGYGNHDRHQSIDWSYAAAAVTELAKFHALSVVYQYDYPEQFKYLSDKVAIQVFNEESFSNIVTPGMEAALSVVREENRDKLKKFLDKLDITAYCNYIQPLKRKFLVHGDFRSSNMMHRVLDDGSVEVIPVDYQTPGVGCPVIDLLYLICTGTDKKFRDEYYERLIEHYYTQLRDHMVRVGLDPEDIYSREDFNHELKVNLPYGLVTAIIGLPFITVDSENAPEIGGDLADLHITTLGATYADRMNAIIDDFVRWGVLTDA